MDKFIKILKNWFGEDEVSDEQVEKAKTFSEESATELTGAIAELKKYREDFLPEFDAAVTVLAKAAVWPSIEAGEKEEDAEDEAALIEVLSDVEKAGAKFSNASLSQLKKIKAAIDSLIGNLEQTEKNTGDEKLSKDTQDKLARLKKLEDEEAVRKAAEDMAAEKQKETDMEARITAKLTKGMRKGSKQIKPGDGDGEGGKETEVEKTDEELWPSLVNSAPAADDDAE